MYVNIFITVVNKIHWNRKTVEQRRQILYCGCIRVCCFFFCHPLYLIVQILSRTCTFQTYHTFALTKTKTFKSLSHTTTNNIKLTKFTNTWNTQTDGDWHQHTYINICKYIWHTYVYNSMIVSSEKKKITKFYKFCGYSLVVVSSLDFIVD